MAKRGYELFSELYNRYFRAVEAVLHQAQEDPLSAAAIAEILAAGAFSESVLSILPKLQSGAWPLLRQSAEGYTAACRPLDNNPLTKLQQAWIRAMLEDQRMRLFLDETEIEKLKAVLPADEALYGFEDFYTFDKAADSDNYDNSEYRKNFRLFLAAIRTQTALRVRYEGGKGHRLGGIFHPYKLEYSPKDDKFRAYCSRRKKGKMTNFVLNLGRVVSAEAVEDAAPEAYRSEFAGTSARHREVVFEITRERNALERCMVQFAHFEKRTRYDETDDKYICTMRYDEKDETEVLIRLLSFGPTVHVLEPAAFVREIQNRVRRQAALIRAQKDTG